MTACAFTEHFAHLPDPRIPRTRLYALCDLLFAALCACLAGADDYLAMANWAATHHAWLRELGGFPNATPSHDTFRYLFLRLDPDHFAAVFRDWTALLPASPPANPAAEEAAPAAPAHFAVDGKVLCGSRDRTRHPQPLRTVTAWSSEQQLVLAQVAVAPGESELDALPQVLGLFDCRGGVVTVDAGGCYTPVLEAIVAAGADYVVTVKHNQPHLRTAVEEFLDAVVTGEVAAAGVEQQTTVDWDHGRREERRVWWTADVEWLADQVPLSRWPQLRSLGVVESRRRAQGPDGPETVERRYFISSLPGTPGQGKTFARAVRQHWGIENKLHWVLDLAFREDEARVWAGHGALNLATLRRLAVNLLRQDRSCRLGLKNRRLRAAWDVDYLAQILSI